MSKTKIGEFKKPKTIAMIMLAVMLATAATAAFSTLQENDADASSVRGSVLYKDVDGSDKYCTDPVVLTVAYLAGVNYELDTGWYVSYGSISFTKTIEIVGDVKIILVGETTVTTNGINIKSGKSLTLYGQGNSGDRISSSNTSIVLNGGSLINAATIQCISSYKTIVNVVGGSDNSITNYGTITSAQGNTKVIASTVDLKVTNYKDITANGAYSYVLYVEGNITLTNYSNGAITTAGSMSTIVYANGGKITNSGTIRSSGSNNDAVVFQSTATVVNNPGGLIRGTNNAIMMNGGGNVTNGGTIGDTYMSGYAVYIKGGNVTNNSGGMILGSHAVAFGDSGKLYNSGQVGGLSIGVESIDAAAVVLVNNNLISGGILLHDVVNHVTFAAGSKVYGNFVIGTDPASTLTFVGTPGSTLTYATIDGNVTIGTKLVFVDIDVDALPAALVPGNKLILINAYAFAGTPGNDKVIDGGYDFSLYVEGGRRLVALLNGLPSYGIELSENEYTFPSATVGYSPQPTLDVTVTNIGTAITGGLTISVLGTDPGGVDIDMTFIANITATAGNNSVNFSISPHNGLAPGEYHATVTVSPAEGNTNPIEPVSVDLCFMVIAAPIGHHEYYINAVSDSGSTISPHGTVVLNSGTSKKFTFSALPGYEIAAVVIDGKPLPLDKVVLGYYTFSNVHSNHTIQVWSTVEELVILTIDVVEGKGHAKFSVNGGMSQDYVSSVPIPKGAYLTVFAYGDDGYEFKEWKVGTTSYTSSTMSFPDVTESMHLDLYFEESKEDFPWWIVVVALLGSLFLFFIILFRRRYDVFIPESSAIVGKDTVGRKKAYVFTVNGGYSGAVSYRVKEDGEWKQVSRNEDGEYMIPKNEVIGDIYLKDPAQ